jgi:S-adenosylmethionine synthetase
MAKQPAVRFRRKIYVSRPFHADAIAAALRGMSELSVMRVYDRIAAGKENIEFGYAYEDGSEFEPTTMQDARKLMYGFD